MLMTQTPRLSDPLPTVLLIEGNPTARQIALSMLRHLGVEAAAAASAPAGLASAREARVDVALVAAPPVGLSGADAVAGLRAAGVSRIVALAASPASVPVADGFDVVVQTPLSVAALAAALVPSETEPEAPDHLIEAVRAHVRSLLGEEDEAFVQELMVSFAESAREAAAQAAAAAAAADAVALTAAAHALKGSASNVGLDDLQAAWAVVEEAARTGAVPAATVTSALTETERTVGQIACAVGV